MNQVVLVGNLTDDVEGKPLQPLSIGPAAATLAEEDFGNENSDDNPRYDTQCKSWGAEVERRA